MLTARECREHADKLYELARMMTSESVRVSLIQTAQAWERMAEATETILKPHD